MIKINPDEQSHSDEGGEANEGFVRNQIIVENHEKNKEESTQKQLRSTDFQPHFVRGSLILRKEPQEVYQQGREIEPIKIEEIREKLYLRRVSEEPLGLYDFYIDSGDYRLVYNRLGKKPSEQLINDYTAHNIDMKHMIEFKQSNYSTFKEFLRVNCQKEDINNKNTLTFDSKFQSGNLMYAFQCKDIPHQYHLMMQNDVNTRGYNQWFYFAVINPEAHKEYRVRITNFRKKSSLFSEGMKPVIFSLENYKLNKEVWTRSLQNVRYGRTGLVKNIQNNDPLYSLEFTFQTKFQNDYILIAMAKPYSYSKLISFLNKINVNSENITYSRQIIAHTPANNAIPLITITSPKQNKKKIILIQARQHPGETWSSYLIEKIIEQLLNSHDHYSQYLRDTFIFKLIPMVNIDGVIYGNFRCDITGMDLNRQWKHPNRYLHPHICQIKQKMTKLSKEYQFDLFIDLHGHSKKYNSFFYSCQKDYQACRILPLILSKFAPTFSLPDCTFGITGEKYNTARAFFFGLIRKDNVLTLELSFFGTKQNNHIEVYQSNHMKQLAISLMKSIYVYTSKGEISGILRSQVQKELKNNIKQYEQYDRKNQNDSGSESDPYLDQIQLETLKQILPVNMHKTLELNINSERFRKTIESPDRENRRSNNKSPKINRRIKIDSRQFTLSRDNQQIIRSSPKKLEIQKISMEKRKSVQKTKNQSIEIVLASSPRHQQSTGTPKNLKEEQRNKFTITTNIRPEKNINKHITTTSPTRKQKPNIIEPITPQYPPAHPNFRKSIQSTGSIDPQKRNKQLHLESQNKHDPNSIATMYPKQMTLFQPQRRPSKTGIYEGSESTREINYPMIGMVPNINSFLLRDEPRLSFGMRKQIITFQKYKKKAEKQKPKYLQLSKILNQTRGKFLESQSYSYSLYNNSINK